MKETIKFLLSSWLGRAIIIGILTPPLFYGFQIYRKFDSFSLKEGVVINKQYHPARAQWFTNPVTPGRVVEHPEKWTLVIEGRDSKGEFKQSEVVVTQKEFQSAKVGSSYSVNKQ